MPELTHRGLRRLLRVENEREQLLWLLFYFYKYLDEMIELFTELGMPITEAEIVRTNSTGLTIYNPKNLADRIKGMKNQKEKTREEKIAERMAYMQQSTVAN